MGCPECPAELFAMPILDGTSVETLVRGCESRQGRGGSFQCPGLDLMEGGGGFLPYSGGYS